MTSARWDCFDMTIEINETHDPSLQSWIESANDPATDFPLQNLPFGVFRRKQGVEPPRVGVAIGDRILDVARAHRYWDLGEAGAACDAPMLNPLMALGAPAWSEVRRALQSLLGTRGLMATAAREHADELLVPQDQAELRLPAQIGDYTDFYASVHHATNVGAMFRPDNPLLPNYKWVPIGYHGRASSIVVSGNPVRRPAGQRKAPDAAEPSFGPSRQLDYELELGAFVGPGNPLGESVPLADAESRIFGVCLVNDWSARDVQAWEYQPLGPFLAKNFATTIGPWVVTLEALAPFRAPVFRRAEGDPAPLPHLFDPSNETQGGLAVTLEVWLRSEAMRAAGTEAVRVSHGSFVDMYWTLAQMLAHHTSNGCNLRPGDLFASGTVSGATADSRGCLLELTRRGKEPLALPGGEQRGFLEDGDEVILAGWAERDGFRRVGLGRCAGRILPTGGAPQPGDGTPATSVRRVES